MKTLTTLAFLGLSMIGAASGCQPSDPCPDTHDFDRGFCTPKPAAGGAGMGGGSTCLAFGEVNEDALDEEPNFGAPCTECRDECVGGTVCGVPQVDVCIGLCGPGDPFEDNCPDGLPCTDVGLAMVCGSEEMAP